MAIIQVGAEHRYGHLDSEVLEILSGRLVLCNDREGRVHITDSWCGSGWRRVTDLRAYAVVDNMCPEQEVAREL